MSRRGRIVASAALGVATALACAGLALADDVPVPTITDTTTTVTTDTTATTTTAPTLTDTTPTTATTTTATAATTTAAATTAARHPAPAAPTGPPCVGAGPLLMLLPHHQLRSVGAVSARVPAGAGATALTYPDSGAVLRAAAERADVSGCGVANATATSSLRRLSLFGGAIRVRELKATLVPANKGWRLRSTFQGLVVGGVLVTFKQRKTVPVGDWGVLKRDGRHTLRTAPNTTHLGLGWWQSGLSLQLIAPHGGLPAGTRLMIGYVAADYAYALRKHGPTGRPLTATPPLEAGPYTFPVAGPASYSDTYGGPRSDVPGGWHHGDDIFASLGEPVVAVANGTVFRVGWERLGGWRLWLRDKHGNRFYYAHLSGYTRLARNGKHVRAGQQLGFVGNTGDAFTTPRHLHFEIHPKRFRKLGYNGAVDPTTYLESWKRVDRIAILVPAPLPAGASLHGDGAVSDYRELLVVRGIRRPPTKPAALASVLHRPLPGSAVGRVAAGSSSHSLVAALAAGLVSLFVLSALAFRRRRRSVG